MVPHWLHHQPQSITAVEAIRLDVGQVMVAPGIYMSSEIYQEVTNPCRSLPLLSLVVLLRVPTACGSAQFSHFRSFFKHRAF